MTSYSNKYLFLRSCDRNPGGSSSQFTVKLPMTYHNVAGISLVSAEVPFSFYNVASSFCSGVRFDYGASWFNMVIPAGQYTITDFQAVMLTSLQANLPSALCTSVDYNKITGKLSISYTGGSLFSVQATTSGQLWQLMGCVAPGIAVAGNGSLLQFPAVAQLFPYSSLLMCVDNLPASVLSTSSLHAFARIQVNAAPGGMVMVCNGTNVVNSVAYKAPIASLDSLAVSLKNNDGTLLGMNGVDWTCTLLISSSD